LPAPEAKRRLDENKRWFDSLTPQERKIAETADRLLNRVLKPIGATAMCYRMTFFLHLYLAELGIQTIPVVGYINDGTDDIMISHAWLDYDGRKTDITLANTERPDIIPIGQVIILDRVVHNGHTYSYHLEQSAKGLAAEAGMLQEPQSAEVVNMKRAEHLAMIARARDTSVMRTFLNSAPDRMTFEMLKAVVNKILIIK
jgi:hypothetical protein